MKACVSVDYLSHEWSCTDLIQAHRELQRQKSKNAFNLTTKQHTASQKELKRLNIERVRQIRYQNAIWRQMARSCTKKLSYSNQMIHPSSVNWQKESDVTWLYGPLYMPPESSSDLLTHPSLSFLSPLQCKKPTMNDNCYTAMNKNSITKKASLKPVLKKNIPSSSSVMLQKEYWIRNDRYWSKCASDSGKQSVRFNPNITEVKFLPETPVKESFNSSKKPNEHSSYFSLDSEGEEDEDDEDDEEIWDVIAQVGSYFKSVIFSSLFSTKVNSSTPTTSSTSIPNQTLTKQNQQVIKTDNRNLFNFDLIQFCVSSAVSFTAWIMYKTFSTVINRTPFASRSSNGNNHIKTQRRSNTTTQHLLQRKNNSAIVV